MVHRDREWDTDLIGSRVALANGGSCDVNDGGQAGIDEGVGNLSANGVELFLLEQGEDGALGWGNKRRELEDCLLVLLVISFLGFCG